jgi:putative transposase
VFNQKLDYIHYNSVKAGLCKLPEDYYYSSAKFYFNGVDAFDMLTDADE